MWPLIAATPILGLSQGLVVGSGLAAINKRAPAQRRGEVASTYFLALFLGLSIPVVAVGFASDALGLRTAGLLVSAGQEGTLRLWDATRGRELRRFSAGPEESSRDFTAVRVRI